MSEKSHEEPLQIKYRFRTLEDFWGNDSLKLTLSTKLASQAPPNTFFFVGPRGCGKTSLAEITAKTLGCQMDTDYEELNVSQAGGIDEARRILQEMHLMPHGNVRVYCLDECQGGSRQFFEALLKPTEKPPRHVKFIFCTTDPKKLFRQSPALDRRGPIFEVKPVAAPLMRSGLWRVVEAEGLKDGFPQEAIEEIVIQADGSPGMALKLLDQIIDIPDNDAMVEAIRKAAASEATVRDLCRALLNERATWERDIAPIISSLPEGEDAEGVRRKVLGYMAKVVDKEQNMRAFTIIECFKDNTYDSGLAGLKLMALRSIL